MCHLHIWSHLIFTLQGAAGAENRLLSFCICNTQGKLLNPRRCSITGKNGFFLWEREGVKIAKEKQTATFVFKQRSLPPESNCWSSQLKLKKQIKHNPNQKNNLEALLSFKEFFSLLKLQGTPNGPGPGSAVNFWLQLELFCKENQSH